MNEEMLELIQFIGFGIYAITTFLFLSLFLKIRKQGDGSGLDFLKIVTFGIFVGSLVISCMRYCELYVVGFEQKWIAPITSANAVILFIVGLYLNYLFHKKNGKK